MSTLTKIDFRVSDNEAITVERPSPRCLSQLSGPLTHDRARTDPSEARTDARHRRRRTRGRLIAAERPPVAAMVRHEAAAMTVGDLRAALAELDDSTPIKVAVPDGRVPGEGVGVDDGYTIVGVGFGRSEGATGGWRPSQP